MHFKIDSYKKDDFREDLDGCQLFKYIFLRWNEFFYYTSFAFTFFEIDL